MVERGSDSLPPADDGSSSGRVVSYGRKVMGGWAESFEPKEIALWRIRDGVQSNVPIAVETNPGKKSPLGINVNHPDAEILSSIGTSDSPFGRAARKVIAEFSRTEREGPHVPDSAHFPPKTP